MRAFAPGKLVLTGAYAVLEGAPAIAVAVSRGAIADSSRVALSATPEVQAAIGDRAAPHADASSMFVGGRKLGLGASAAILVASIAALENGDLADAEVRERLFTRAREAHARAQSGGSGIDVAASVFGGAIEYVMGAPVKSVVLPYGLRIEVFACGTSARTTDLRATVDRHARENKAAHDVLMSDLCSIARAGSLAVQTGDGDAFIDALRRTARALDRLGTAAKIGIVPSGFDALEALAAGEGAAFCVSGAGGGDVAVYVGRSKPSTEFLQRAHALGLFSLALSLDPKGVRIAPPASAVAESVWSAPTNQ
jgi:phosphomevalonate kinase